MSEATKKALLGLIILLKISLEKEKKNNNKSWPHGLCSFVNDGGLLLSFGLIDPLGSGQQNATSH